MLRPPLGQSLADHEGGTYSSVFLERVQDAAAEANVPWDIVLAYAAAHETVILLGSEAHTARGLMKAHWGRDDYLEINQHQLHFIDEQAHQLANRYGRSPSTGPPVNLASGDSPQSGWTLAGRHGRPGFGRKGLLNLCHPDLGAELRQFHEHFVPGDAEIWEHVPFFRPQKVVRVPPCRIVEVLVDESLAYWALHRRIQFLGPDAKVAIAGGHFR